MFKLYSLIGTLLIYEIFFNFPNFERLINVFNIRLQFNRLNVKVMLKWSKCLFFSIFLLILYQLKKVRAKVKLWSIFSVTSICKYIDFKQQKAPIEH